jgi:hypothetical protein
MARERILTGDLVWAVPKRIAGMGNTLILLRLGSPPSEVVQLSTQALSVFLRRERIDMSVNRAIFPIILLDGCEYTIIHGHMRLCK